MFLIFESASMDSGQLHMLYYCGLFCFCHQLASQALVSPCFGGHCWGLRYYTILLESYSTSLILSKLPVEMMTPIYSCQFCLTLIQLLSGLGTLNLVLQELVCHQLPSVTGEKVSAEEKEDSHDFGGPVTLDKRPRASPVCVQCEFLPRSIPSLRSRIERALHLEFNS